MPVVDFDSLLSEIISFPVSDDIWGRWVEGKVEWCMISLVW